MTEPSKAAPELSDHHRTVVYDSRDEEQALQHQHQRRMVVEHVEADRGVDETVCTESEEDMIAEEEEDMMAEEEKPIVALEKERVCLVEDDEYLHHHHHHHIRHHQQQLSSLSDLVSRHSIDSLDQECGHTAEDPDDGNYPGSCLSAEDSGIHTEDMSSCVSQADDEERSNLQPSPVQQQHQQQPQQQQQLQQLELQSPDVVQLQHHADDTYNMVRPSKSFLARRRSGRDVAR